MAIQGVELKNPEQSSETIVIKEVKNAPTKYDEKERVLLIDADSLLYFAVHFPEDSLMEFPTEEEQIEEAKYRVGNKLQEIQNNVEEWYNIKETLIFVAGKDNFRYKIYPDYKSNRADRVKSPLLPIVNKYIVEELGAIPSHGAEADDYLYSAMVSSGGNCVVSTIDKDIVYNSPNVPVYNYRSYNDVLGEFKYISEKESRLAIASQVVIGDTSDGVPGAYRVGKTWCRDNMHEDMTDYQFIKAILKAYLKANGGNFQLAKEQIRMYYKVLKLYTIDELSKLNEWE